jgi:hypothetical protein
VKVAAPLGAAPAGVALRARAGKTVPRLPDFKEKSMPIRVNCKCGKNYTVKDELRGKRLKCPACQTFLVVGAASPAPPRQPNGNGGASNPAVRQQPNANGGGKKKGRKGMLFALLGTAFLLSGCCCTGVVGVGVVWFWPFGSSSGADQKIVGKWVSHVEAPKPGASADDLMNQAFGAGMIEFKADGTVIDMSPMTPIMKGKWKTLSANGNAISVELSDRRSTNKLDITFVSDNSVKITPADSKKEFSFKRLRT